MKFTITSFSALLVGCFTLLMFLLWILSLLVLAERQNQQAGSTLQHTLQVQVQQLRQNQQLWLQSQYYLLNTLAKSPDNNQNFQSFLWGYYQRNPSIWAVNLVPFNKRGLPLSKSSKPGCLQPEQMLRFEFDNFLVPRISTCSIDDKALLEIAGPVVTDGDSVVLLISMDYFDFLHEFTNLTGRKLQRVADNAQGFQFYEFGVGTNNESVRVEIAEAGTVFGELHLALQPLSFWALFQRQIAMVATVLLLGALLAFMLLRRYLIGPMNTLAGDMRDTRKCHPAGAG